MGHGKHTVGTDKDWLRIRMPRHTGISVVHHGKYLTCGMEDNRQNRRAVEDLAVAMDNDASCGQFDDTLSRYVGMLNKPQTPSEQALVLLELFGNYCAELRQRGRAKATIDRYRYAFGFLRKHWQQHPQKVTKADARAVVALTPPRSAKVVAHSLSALWVFCGLKPDIWKGITPRVPAVRRQPLTPAQRDAIYRAFAAEEWSHHYLPVIKFLLATGARPGEAFALRWESVSKDCKVVSLVDSLDRAGLSKNGVMKTARAARTLRMPPSVVELLLSLRDRQLPPSPGSRTRGAPDDIVFPSPTGGYQDVNRFSGKVWRPLVKAALSDEYQPLYACRHTALTGLLDSGLHALAVAELGGTSVRMLEGHYYSGATRNPLPEL